MDAKVRWEFDVMDFYYTRKNQYDHETLAGNILNYIEYYKEHIDEFNEWATKKHPKDSTAPTYTRLELMEMFYNEQQK